MLPFLHMKGPEVPTLRPEIPKGSTFSEAQRKLREIMKRTKSVPQTSEESTADWEAWKKMNPDAEAEALLKKASETLPDPSIFRQKLVEAGTKILFTLSPTAREDLRTYLDIYAVIHAGTENGRWAGALHRVIDPDVSSELTAEQVTRLQNVLN